MSITELSIKRPLLIIVIFFTMILFGFISYKSLNYNLLPKFEANVLSVSTTYRGASADEVQSSITKPVEDAISSIEGVDHVNSSSMEGVSVVIIQLKSGVSTITAQRDAERKINQMKSKLPTDADDPVVNRFNSEELPVLRISASAKLSPTELYDLVDQQIKPILSNVDGVGSVNLIGGNQREIQVAFDRAKLEAYKITPTQIYQAIANTNISYPAGSVESEQSRFSLRLDEKFMKVEDLRNLIIAQSKDGGRIYLKDVATITDTQTEYKTVNRINGNPGIGIEIVKQADANAVKVSELVKKKMDELTKTYASKGLTFQIAIDQSVYTLASADAVMHDLMLAVIIVAMVMLLFLHSIRSSLFVLVALPSAMIPTFILMYAFGFSLNLMTLMALSLVVGILVDDSIVILENIFRHMEMGKDRMKASIEGRAEIGFTAIAITLVDVVVFVPMALSGGMIGNILREFSLVVVFSTLMSLMVSFTLTPLLASRFANLVHLSKENFFGRFFLAFENMLEKLKEFYGRSLAWSLKHKRYVLIGVLVLFVASFSLIPAGFIGTAFVSPSDRGELNISLEMEPGTPLYTTNKMVFEAERMVMAHPEVEKVFSNVGTQSGNALTGNTSTSNIAEIAVRMVDKEKRKITSDQFGEIARNEISRIPGVKVTIKPTGITGNSDAPIQIALKGVNMDTIWKAAKILKTIVEKTPGTDYTEFSTKNPQNEISVDIDREKMNMVGLSIPEIGLALQTTFRGNDQLKFTDKGEEYAINVISERYDRRDIESVRNITIRNNKGANVRLGDIAKVEQTLGQAVLQRSDRLNSIKVTAFTAGRPAGTVIGEIQAAVEKAKIPEGVIVDYQGQAQQQKDAFGSLGLAMLIGFLLVYLIMVALYESTIYPLVVMFSIPVALIGAFLALALSMETLSIFAIVGLIMLMGLVAKNGILIVDFTNHLKENGYSRTDALIEAGKERLRPILMTTVAMIVGMLPIALSKGSGAEVKNGMAWVIIGGLSSSLLLTLVLVPTMYYLIDSAKERVGRLFSGKKKQEQQVAHS
ncbi:MAG TPA: efflux RND transporter permease subunit [Cytophagaceae bacterium]|nr:efflux RND transporter permease subunit [Cytophagaceae bacterium]